MSEVSFFLNNAYVTVVTEAPSYEKLAKQEMSVLIDR